METLSINPFEVIDKRLLNIESLLHELKTQNQIITQKTVIPQSERVLINECSEITGLAKATIRTLAHFRKIPFHKEGKFLSFKRSEILFWLEQGRPTIAEMKVENYINNK